MEFIVDDLEEARSFIGSLNRKIVRQRFSSFGGWKPDRIVLAVHNGKVVAMADCVVFPEANAANASLLADSGLGGYAVTALLHLKRLVAARHWHSTLRVPTAATLGISRRYFDTTLDQAAWEISSKLVEEHGEQQHLRPTPLIASDSFLKTNGLPLLQKWDEHSRMQILALASDPQKGALRTPAGYDLHATELMTLAFELLNVPAEVRQHVTRTMLISLAAVHGHDFSSMIGKQVKTDALSRFFTMLAPFRSEEPPPNGLFAFRTLNTADFADAMRKVVSGDLPSNRAPRLVQSPSKEF